MTDSADAIDWNSLWSEHLFNELVCSGITLCVLSPGARSSPLALAAASRTDLECVTHFDERGSAFFALGHAKATRAPVALVCTSGTAVANYLPAVIEAQSDEIPLIIISADRPPERHQSGANQTMQQSPVFGSYVNWQFQFPPPSPAVDIRFVRSTACEAFRQACAQSGPVHLNLPFREPLVGTRTKPDVEPVPFTAMLRSENMISDAAVRQLTGSLQSARRGVLAIGSLPPGTEITPLLAFARMLGWPCCLDITSQLRFSLSDREEIFSCHFDGYLRSNTTAIQEPDCVIRIGGRFVSKYLDHYLARCTGPYYHLSSCRQRLDPEHSVTHHLHCDVNSLGRAVAAMPRSGTTSALLKPFLDHELRIEKEIAGALESESPLPQWATTRQAIMLPETRRAFFIGNSLAIREADATTSTGSLGHVIGTNRGVSGIDGLIASACGFARGCQLPLTAILGDVSALHDLNSLALTAELPHPSVFVINNNDGGAIFSLLPDLREQPELERFFQTPHGLQFRPAAEMFGLQYAHAPTPTDFANHYRRALASTSSTLLEISCSPESGLALLQL